MVFLPFAIRAEPARKLIGSFDRRLFVVAVDMILFANMMNMVTLGSKSILVTILMALLCGAGASLLVSAVRAKKGETK